MRRTSPRPPALVIRHSDASHRDFAAVVQDPAAGAASSPNFPPSEARPPLMVKSRKRTERLLPLAILRIWVNQPEPPRYYLILPRLALNGQRLYSSTRPASEPPRRSPLSACRCGSSGRRCCSNRRCQPRSGWPSAPHHPADLEDGRGQPRFQAFAGARQAGDQRGIDARTTSRQLIGFGVIAGSPARRGRRPGAPPSGRAAGSIPHKLDRRESGDRGRLASPREPKKHSGDPDLLQTAMFSQ